MSLTPFSGPVLGLLDPKATMPIDQHYWFHGIFVVLFILVNVSFVYDVVARFREIFAGLPADRKGDLGKRIGSVVFNVLLQKKLFKRPLRGLFHVFVFYGFLYYVIHTTSQMVAGMALWNSADPYHFHLIPINGEGSLGALYVKGLDVISILVLIGLGGFSVRRWVLKAKELDRPSGQSALIIAFISVLMLSTLLGNAALLKADPGKYMAAATPVSIALSNLIPANPASADFFHAITWWVHIGAVFAFMIVVPKSKHSHLIFAPFNFFWTNTEPKGAIKYMDLEDETLEAWGATNVTDFSWPQLLDGVSCIECGRCQLSCPANSTGKALNPKKIMTDLKHALMEKMPEVLDGKADADTRVIDNYTTYEEIWACTTCYACVDQCPVGNNQVESIIDMRRAYVLNESKFPAELQGAFTNMENNSNPWGVGAHTRADWAEGLDIKIFSELENPQEVEYMYFVGCAGAFDDRNKKIARSLVNVLNRAGVSFAILGTEESCTGDSARRAGNEYLFQMMAMGNIETFNGYGVKKIITACPHCYNTIKNEYPQFGGDYEVLHHTQLLAQLIEDDQIKIDKSKMSRNETVTFHDSCYMSRYNDETAAPRLAIEEATGTNVTDIKESKTNSFCCGAGGAQMWMEETEGTRVNETRVNQLLKAEPDTIGTSCPFCITMVTDGVKGQDKLDSVKVLDVAEIVEKAMI